MPDTSFDITNVAHPYRYDLKKGSLKSEQHDTPYSYGNIGGAAALVSTVEDLKNLFNALINTDKLLDIPHKSLMFSPIASIHGVEFQGNGLRISYDHVLNIGHSGDSYAHSSQLRYFPKQDYLMISLTNNKSGSKNFYSFFRNNIPVAN